MPHQDTRTGADVQHRRSPGSLRRDAGESCPLDLSREPPQGARRAAPGLPHCLRQTTLQDAREGTQQCESSASHGGRECATSTGPCGQGTRLHHPHVYLSCGYYRCLVCEESKLEVACEPFSQLLRRCPCCQDVALTLQSDRSVQGAPYQPQVHQQLQASPPLHTQACPAHMTHSTVIRARTDVEVAGNAMKSTRHWSLPKGNFTTSGNGPSDAQWAICDCEADRPRWRLARVVGRRDSVRRILVDTRPHSETTQMLAFL